MAEADTNTEAPSNQLDAYVDVLENADAPIPLSLLSLEEGYNIGWEATATMATPAAAALDMSAMMELSVESGLSSGTAVALILSLPGGENGPTFLREADTEGVVFSSLPQGTSLRTWPSVITGITPAEVADGSIGNLLTLTARDPVSYLADRPIWGAYRLCSIAEMIGGALSLAAGGNGKPTLRPILPGLPAVSIVNELREEVDLVPYSVAAGTTLGGWLGEISQLLGIRQEMRLGEDGSVELVLKDQAISGVAPAGDTPEFQSISTHVLPDSLPGSSSSNLVALNLAEQALDPSDNSPSSDQTIGDAHVVGMVTQAPLPNRGIVFDDPLHGTFRHLGQPGAVGTVVCGTGLGINEAAQRALYPSYGAYTESLRLQVICKNPSMRPGRIVAFNEEIIGIAAWQVFSVRHIFRAGKYDNLPELLSSRYAWHPTYASISQPTFVTATVDGGDGFEAMDPVQRDRLGRIPVRLSFLPSSVGEEADILDAGDENKDGRLTLADFDEETLQDYEENSEEWEGKQAAYQAGEYEDPHFGREDSDLNEEELAERRATEDQKTEALRYIAAQRAKRLDTADKDRDGYASSRDAAISDELSTVLTEPGSASKIEAQLAARDAETLREDFEEADIVDEALLDEYRSLFGGYEGEDVDPNLDLKVDAKAAQESWPPRIPVTSIETMAGGLHGFLSAHRQGDICRLAVHNPLFIELIGHQYRSDHQINDSVVNVTAGMIIEHDDGEAWSGLVFRPTDMLEDPIP